MENKVIENYQKGYNCAQAVLMAYAEKNNLDKELILKMSVGLGFGMYSKETCGAVSAAIMILGLKYGNDNPGDRENIRDVFKKIKHFEKEFKEENKSFNCLELKTEHKIDCNDIIRKSVKIIENM